MAISLFTVWVPTMFGVCQALSVLMFCVVFWTFVGYLSLYFLSFSMVTRKLVPISQIENFL